MTSKVVNSIDLPILHAGGINAQARLGERLDLIEHVNARVTVSLGETEIPISKLFALASGDVLSLDREADDCREARIAPSRMTFKLTTHFSPKGDQPEAIAELAKGLERDERDQVLLGITGSGKTFTVANVIERSQRRWDARSSRSPSPRPHVRAATRRSARGLLAVGSAPSIRGR